MKITITLIGGIGNIIQTIPLMAWLKENGNAVQAYQHPDAYCSEICEMAAPSYDELIYELPKSNKCKGSMMASAEGKKLTTKMPEWKAWFRFHGLDVPDKVTTPLDYDKVKSPSKVVFAPCCKPNWPMKRWPHWQQLVDKMPGCAVVGLPGDGNIKGDFIDLRGKTTLRHLAGILADADYVIAEEGGVAHLACAVGTRTYIMYGGTNPIKNLQPSNAVQVISSKQFKCRPCQEKGWYVVPGSPYTHHGCRPEEKIDGFSRCMDAISVYEVMKAVSDHGDCCILNDYRK